MRRAMIFLVQLCLHVCMQSCLSLYYFLFVTILTEIMSGERGSLFISEKIEWISMT